MNAETIHRLNQINRDFYRVTAGEFDQTRGKAWPGWEKLLEHVNAPESLSVLDVGCGNGRFAVFLAERLGAKLIYHGQDNNAALLDYARAALDAAPNLTATLEMRDVVENPPDSGAYDLVVAFGLLHHIPGAQRRRDFVRALAERVAPGGLLAFACWRFYDYERFRARVVAWPDDLAGQVEPGDYLLDWRRGEVALRYCHHVDADEQNALINASALDEVLTYTADGFDGALNRYSLLRKPEA